MSAKVITAERARELLAYDPDTGILTWRISRGNGVCAGAIAGRVNAGGYRQVTCDNRMYLAHRLAWLIHTGEWPTSEDIDHINRENDDNRWTNLREATHAENGRNRKLSSNNKSGVSGVHQCNGRWIARIKIDGRHTHLGSFKELGEAAAVRKAAEQKYYGEFRPEGFL